MPKLTRKEREQNRRRRDILDAALRVFAEKGYTGATMAEISRASEFPLGTIYNFFNGKEDIYSELVIGKGRELGDILVAIFDDDRLSPLQRLEKSLLGNVAFFVKNRPFIKIYISGRSNVDAPLLTNFHKRVNRMHDKMIELYTALFQEGIQKKEFRSFSPQEMATIFSGVVNASIWAWLVQKEDDANLENRLRRAFEIFTGGVCRREAVMGGA